VTGRARFFALRFAVLFGTIPVAFVVALVAHSANVFVVVMAIALLVSVGLRVLSRR
jgi:hypothetical protein